VNVARPRPPPDIAAASSVVPTSCTPRAGFFSIAAFVAAPASATFHRFIVNSAWMATSTCGSTDMRA
jgi:hypothetical protein